jgi:hypothetical protein
MGYQMYHDWKSAVGPGTPTFFSQHEVVIFEWIDTHAEMRQQVGQYLDLLARSGEIPQMRQWDGVKHPTLGDQARLFLEGLSIGRSNIMGAIGLEIGRHLHPHDLEHQLQIARLWGTAGDILFAAAEARGAAHKTQGWTPGRGEIGFHASGNKPHGWGRHPNEFLGLGVPSEPPHQQETDQKPVPGPSDETSALAGEDSTSPDSHLDAAQGDGHDGPGHHGTAHDGPDTAASYHPGMDSSAAASYDPGMDSAAAASYDAGWVGGEHYEFDGGIGGAYPGTGDDFFGDLVDGTY